MKYLIDTNVFIQAKNMYYRFDFCGGFWDWMKTAHQNGLIYSIKKVREELNAGADQCATWIQTLPSTFFLDDLNDPAVMAEYGKIMQWSGSSHFRPAAITEFAKQNVADAFLIAVAKAHNYTIVTQELGNPAARNRILIPDAATVHGVNTVYVYDMLSAHTISTFVAK